MSTSTLDSCNVQVTVRELRPLPTGPSIGRHYAMLDVTIGSLAVDGLAAFDESAGVLVLATEGVDSLPVMVQEVLNDLGSPSIAARVRESIEAAVQQFDREAGHLGDGPDSTWVCGGPRHPTDFFRKFGIGAERKRELFSNPELAARVASLTRARAIVEQHAASAVRHGFDTQAMLDDLEEPETDCGCRGFYHRDSCPHWVLPL